MSLDSLFLKHGTDKSSKNHNYGPIYEKYLDPESISALLELGVARGASLRAWYEWCPHATIHGIDLTPVYVAGCIVRVGDVTDPELISDLDSFDVIIDDASHQLDQIRVSLDLLWPHLNPGGWYVIEDLAANKYEAGTLLIALNDVSEVHRHGEIILARKNM